MPSLYIQAADYATYGVPSTTTVAQVQQGSMLVDSVLKRPEGVEVKVDGAGNPAWMAAKLPGFVFALGANIQPGTGVVVSLTTPSGANFGGALNLDMIGEVVVLDRLTSVIAESCVITAISGNKVTLGNVQFAHSLGATVEMGMVIREERKMPNNRSVTRLSRPGFPRLISGLGRYGYGRRSDQVRGMYADFNLLATISAFGGPPQWIPWDVTQSSISWDTGEVWVPAGLLLAYYSEVRMFYVAGWTYADIPPPIKQATASLIKAVNGTDSPFSDNVRSFRADDITIVNWSASKINSDTHAFLAQYKARILV